MHPRLEVELEGKNFVEEATERGVPLDYRIQEGHKHGYFFAAIFIE